MSTLINIYIEIVIWECGLGELLGSSLSEENWFVVEETSVYGVPGVARGRHIRKLVKPGDVLILYVTKRVSKRLGGELWGYIGLSQSD